MDVIHMVHSFDLKEKIELYNEIVRQMSRDIEMIEKEIAPISIRDFWYALDRRPMSERAKLILNKDTESRLSLHMAMGLLSKYEPNTVYDKQRIKELQVIGNVWFDLLMFGVLNEMI